MANPENDISNYTVVNVNRQRQENKIGLIIKKRNYAGWKLVSNSYEIVDHKNQFSNLYLF